MSKTEKIVTIKEVAKHAGVAISTVSRVLNHLDRVSEETRERVRRAAQELGYVKNNLAASMKTGSTKLIVVVVPDMVNEFYTAVVQGVEEVAVSQGYYPLVFATGDSREKERELFEGKFGRIIDGAVVIPAHTDMDFFKGLNKPMVIVDRYVPGSEMQAIVVDNRKGCYLLAKELIAAGHREIAIILGSLEFNIGLERLEGFMQAMREADIPVNPDCVMQGCWDIRSGYEKARELLARKAPPTALIAANNQICIGCVKAMKDMGLRMGRDVSLVSFDDTLLAGLIEPGITAIQRATVEMGRLGAEKLIHLLKNEQTEGEPRKIVLDVELVRRSSIRHLAGN